MHRIRSLDLARGFTVLAMPSIHVLMLYSTPQVQQSLLGHIMAFIAEMPGAQLFMLIMGVSFTLSSRITQQQVFKRTILLLITAYLLNIFKFILPLKFGLMPTNLLNELHLKNDYSAIPFFLLLGDILHFAAIAYIILYVIYHLPHYYNWSLIIAIAVILISPLIWDIHTGFSIIDYPLSLAGGHPPYVFFPLFPWLVYPLVGMSLGYLLKQFDKGKVFRRTGIFGISLILLSLFFPATKTNKDWLAFYRTEAPDTIFHLGFVLAWLWLFQWLSQKFSYNRFFRLLTFCSKNITPVYLIQWILICWGMAVTGYLTLGFKQTFYWMAGITIVTLLLTILIIKPSEKRKTL